MASISDRDRYAFQRWDSNTFPFDAQQAGRMVYYGRAPAAEGDWEGAAGIGYLTATGVLQTLEWKVPAQHRPIKLVVYHEDAAGVPSAVNLNLDYYYFVRALNRWVRLGGAVSAAATYIEYFGEAREVSDCRYRLTLNPTAGQLLYVTPYNQRLQAKQFKRERQGL